MRQWLGTVLMGLAAVLVGIFAIDHWHWWEAVVIGLFAAGAIVCVPRYRRVQQTPVDSAVFRGEAGLLVATNVDTQASYVVDGTVGMAILDKIRQRPRGRR